MSVRHIHLVLLLAATGGVGCDHAAVLTDGDPPRGERVDWFSDVTDESGVAFQYATPDFKGGGLAVVDLDGDGLPEIVAARRIGGLAMFHNLGGFRFEKVTDSGLDSTLAITAIGAIDLDNDGDRDLVLAGRDVAHVMSNRGDGTFDEVARFDSSGMTEQVLPVDLDGDGLLDLYFSNYDVTGSDSTLNRLYLNRGGLRFAPAVTVGAGMTWTTTAFDVDGDGDQDLYVANDTLLADFGRPVASAPSTSTLHPDLLLRNDGPGPDGIPQFTDLAVDMGMAQPRSSMGGLLGDFDEDGRLDLYVPNLGAKKLLLRDQAGFVDRATPFGVDGIARINSTCGPETEDEDCLLLSWSAALTDFDLDGHGELLVVNGETELGKPPPVLMFVPTADLSYREVSPDLPSLDARGLVVTDLDGDGDQDVVISQKEAPLKLFKNLGRPEKSLWLDVELHGTVSNREGAGAVVTLHLASGRTQIRVVGSGGVIHSAGPVEAFFGLGTDTIETLEVQWPSGRRTVLARPPTGWLVIDEGL